MFSIKDLIAERMQYALGVKTNPWKDELLSHVITDASEDEVAFLTIGSTLFEKRKVEALQKKYNIVGAYKIGNIYTNTGLHFYIVHLSKKPSSGLKIALFNGKCYDSRRVRKNTGDFTLPDMFTEEWEEFCIRLEKWMNSNELPESCEKYEFGFVPNNELYKDSYRPEAYSKCKMKK